MAETDLKIKDAPLSTNISGNVRMAGSDGSGLPVAISLSQVYDFINNGLKSDAYFATKADIPTVGVMLDTEPTGDTLTYIVGGVTYNFELGMSAIYPDAESDDGYGISFFKGTNTEGKAIWGKGGGAGSLNETLIRSIAKEEVAKSSESFGIRWSLDDTVKTIEYVGNTALVDRFKSWVDSSAKPCEIKKDGTDFAYLTNTAGVESSTNWATREDGSASHYQTEDKTDYLQMVELPNINIGSSINQLDRTMTVWFNTDTNCPAGFYRWFKAGKKLFARYDSTFNDDATTIDACYGTSQPTGNWSFDLAHTRTKATNTNLMNITAWEIICLSWIQAAYYQSFDMQTALAGGLQSGSETAARSYINGSTDTLTTPHGKISSGAFRFMYLENAFWGKQWLAGFGWRGEAGKGYLTFDDEKANKAATMALEDADVTMSYLTNCNGTYCKDVDFFTMPIEAGGSSTTGFYDGNWSSASTSCVFYVGGASYIGSGCGAFARSLAGDASISYWAFRARCAMNR